MDILCFGVEPETISRLSRMVKPPEKQEKVSFSDTVVEEVGAGCVGLPGHWHPARLSDEVISDEVGVQMARIGSSYPRLPGPSVETQIFHN
jgi:hypothetical protein